tara:strand:- start:227 stop:1000 length:774 start_codon:yes stop_codon:yes gene_type:complete
MKEKFTSLNLPKWIVESGQNEVLSEIPQNRFSDPDSEPKVSEPHQSRKIVPEDKIDSPTNINSTLIANKASTVAELRESMSKYDGCSLKHTAMNIVFGDGDEKSDIMLIGEAPGADEDREGIPFVGLSGKLLNTMLRSIGLSRSEVYITNIIPWRPPGNRQPTIQETAACLPFIQRHIEIINPKILILVGGTASKTLLVRKEGIMRLRGRWFDYQKNDKTVIPALPIFHPAFLLRSPAQKFNAWKDLLAIRSRLKNL